MKKLIHEPLVHFLTLGAILFGIGILRGDRTGPATNRIAITPGAVERLFEGFRMTWQRLPTESELRGLVEDYLKEEVLYREALEMGLDRNDQIIRRRMRQKLEFLTADLVELFEPTDEELQAHLAADVDLYRREATVSFVQVYIGERQGAEQGRARAMSILEELRTDPNANPEQMGDPFMHPASYRDIGIPTGSIRVQRIDFVLPLSGDRDELGISFRISGEITGLLSRGVQRSVGALGLSDSQLNRSRRSGISTDYANRPVR